jgi:hypothetical protein
MNIRFVSSQLAAWICDGASPSKQAAQHARPAGHRRLPSRQHQPHVLREHRHEGLPQPRVEQPEELIGVQDQHDLMAELAKPPRGSLGSRQVTPGLWFQRCKQATLGRLDRTAVQSNDCRAAGARLDAEGFDECRLADAGDAVDEHDERAAHREHGAEDGHLVLTPDQPRCLLVQQLADGLAHGMIVGRWSIRPRSGSRSA